MGTNRGDCGLVNDVVTEDFQQHEGHMMPSPAQQQSQVQPQSQGQSGPASSVVSSGGGGMDMNVSMDDESLSSINSSKHSFNSLPKGNQIHIDQRPDLLK